MKCPRLFLVLLSSVSLLFVGCGEKSSEKTASANDETHEEDESGGGVSFKEGRGLALNSEIISALGLKTEEAEERPLSAEMKLLAQVFATTPQVLASASVSLVVADQLEKRNFKGASLVRLDRTIASATRRVDAIFSFDLNSAPKVGEFIELTLTSEPSFVLTVPRSAILDAATGTFVYIVNGEHYLRTAVVIGARSGDFAEITDGLYSGDVVVATPVNQLWLSELRLTKGGGHSH